MARPTNLERFNIADNTIRAMLTGRGGGIEISLDALGRKYRGLKMTAYQNYLGGGLLGSIGNDCTLREWREDEVLVQMADRLSRYYHKASNAGKGEWESSDFESLQRRSLSAY